MVLDFATNPAAKTPRLRFRAFLTGSVIYIVLMYPLSWGFFYCTRFLLQFAEWLGIMEKEKGLGGQILGYNFYRHPLWVHWVVDGLAAVSINGLVLCGVLVITRKCIRSSRQTLCGMCGAGIEKSGGLIVEADGCKCPACRARITHSDSSSASLYMVRRFAVMLIALGISHAILNKVYLWDLRSLFLSICEFCGGQVERLSGRMAMGEWGPFFGSGIMPKVYNAIYTYGPICTIEIGSALVGVMMYWIVSGPCRRTRIFGYRGPTLCGGCGYEIASLKSPRCPECGRQL